LCCSLALSLAAGSVLSSGHFYPTRLRRYYTRRGCESWEMTYKAYKEEVKAKAGTEKSTRELPRLLPLLCPGFCLLLLLYLQSLQVTHGLSSDGIALLAFKQGVTFDPFQVLSNWNEKDANPCAWCGVTCSADLRVIFLNISGLAFARASSSQDAAVGCSNNSSSSSLPLSTSTSRCYQQEGGSREGTISSSCCNSSISSAAPLSSQCLTATTASSLHFPICLQNGSILESSSGYSGGDQVPCVLTGTIPREFANLSQLQILSLPFNGLSGNIPAEIAYLKLLRILDLEFNALSGPIPDELGQLSDLCSLNLANNGLDGNIPAALSGCNHLCYLSLAGNMLSGAIPPSLGNLTNLQWLAVSSNLLSSGIPVELTRSCWRLEHLDLAGNFLTGNIPPNIANCSQLQSLLLSANTLSGNIPPDFGRLTNLQSLHLFMNNLSGSIPPQLGNCTELSFLILTVPPGCPFGLNCMLVAPSSDTTGRHQPEGNQFSGSFPPSLALLPNIQVIWAPGAGLSGALPVDWGDCLHLEGLNLAQNSLVGAVPAGLGNCKSLVLLDLSSNELNGTIPPQLPVSCLVILNLSSNALSGSVPVYMDSNCSSSWSFLPSKGNFPSPLTCSGTATPELAQFYCDILKLPDGALVMHDLSSNTLSGPVPGPLLGSTLLQEHTAYFLLLSNNQLTGGVPAGLFSLCGSFRAFAVSLSHNFLSGELPVEIGSCSSLRHFDASANQLSGSIPEAFGNLSDLSFLNLSSNKLEGVIPQLENLQDLEKLILSRNHLMGGIPPLLGTLSSLIVLDLSVNDLDGNIPEELAQLSKLKALLLNNNSLSGSIPESLSNLTSLVQLNLAFNNLSGEFPVMGNWLGLCSSLVVMGNPLLECSVASQPFSSPILTDPEYPVVAPTPASNTEMLGPPGHHFSSIFVAAITSGCAIAVVLLVLVLLFQCTKQQVPGLRGGQGRRREVVTFISINFHLTYENVVQATGNFSLNNLIGTGGFGSTYKAELRPGLVVAVKRLAIGRFQGVQQFDTEIRTLGRIRHPNLVTLIGYHASEAEMFLIYNYFPQGNLESLIHGSERGRTMDWRMRHKIAMDIAHALEYLHDECVPRVLHRDIKPSNILLDNNLNAHLSDFGLARLLGDSETHATTDVAGTFGYVAPEYALTCRVSDKADVYSYGVVLLELLSGKQALDPSFSNYGDGFNIVGWATLLIHQNQPHEVFTVGLWEMGPESDLLEVLKLAVLCTGELLTVRPPMRNVVDLLRQYQPPPLPS